jgi:hypothetical protein
MNIFESESGRMLRNFLFFGNNDRGWRRRKLFRKKSTSQKLVDGKETKLHPQMLRSLREKT